MVAMQNGLPTLWVTHDSRTRELTDFLHLPSVPLEMIGKIKHIEKLFESALTVDEIEGVIINPWNRTIMLNKRLISIILGKNI